MIKSSPMSTVSMPSTWTPDLLKLFSAADFVSQCVAVGPRGITYIGHSSGIGAHHDPCMVFPIVGMPTAAHANGKTNASDWSGIGSVTASRERNEKTFQLVFEALDPVFFRYQSMVIIDGFVHSIDSPYEAERYASRRRALTKFCERMQIFYIGDAIVHKAKLAVAAANTVTNAQDTAAASMSSSTTIVTTTDDDPITPLLELFSTGFASQCIVVGPSGIEYIGDSHYRPFVSSPKTVYTIPGTSESPWRMVPLSSYDRTRRTFQVLFDALDQTCFLNKAVLIVDGLIHAIGSVQAVRYYRDQNLRGTDWVSLFHISNISNFITPEIEKAASHSNSITEEAAVEEAAVEEAAVEEATKQTVATSSASSLTATTPTNIQVAVVDMQNTAATMSYSTTFAAPTEDPIIPLLKLFSTDFASQCVMVGPSGIEYIGYMRDMTLSSSSYSLYTIRGTSTKPQFELTTSGSHDDLNLRTFRVLLNALKRTRFLYKWVLIADGLIHAIGSLQATKYYRDHNLLPSVEFTSIFCITEAEEAKETKEAKEAEEAKEAAASSNSTAVESVVKEPVAKEPVVEEASAETAVAEKSVAERTSDVKHVAAPVVVSEHPVMETAAIDAETDKDPNTQYVIAALYGYWTTANQLRTDTIEWMQRHARSATLDEMVHWMQPDAINLTLKALFHSTEYRKSGGFLRAYDAFTMAVTNYAKCVEKADESSASSNSTEEEAAAHSNSIEESASSNSAAEEATENSATENVSATIKTDATLAATASSTMDVATVAPKTKPPTTEEPKTAAPDTQSMEVQQIVAALRAYNCGSREQQMRRDTIRRIEALSTTKTRDEIIAALTHPEIAMSLDALDYHFKYGILRSDASSIYRALSVAYTEEAEEEAAEEATASSNSSAPTTVKSNDVKNEKDVAVAPAVCAAVASDASTASPVEFEEAAAFSATGWSGFASAFHSILDVVVDVALIVISLGIAYKLIFDGIHIYNPYLYGLNAWECSWIGAILLALAVGATVEACPLRIRVLLLVVLCGLGIAILCVHAKEIEIRVLTYERSVHTTRMNTCTSELTRAHGCCKTFEMAFANRHIHIED